MRNKRGETWESNVFCSPEGMFTFSEREKPRKPFAAMQYIRVFRMEGDVTKITEKVNFDLLPGAEDQADLVKGRIEDHMAQLHPAIKRWIEAVARKEKV
jgi:hypothetical protein